jgi:hypothetical protein
MQEHPVHHYTKKYQDKGAASNHHTYRTRSAGLIAVIAINVSCDEASYGPTYKKHTKHNAERQKEIHYCLSHLL